MYKIPSSGTNTINLYPASINTLKGIKWGYIDNRARIMINPSYDSALDFQDNGLAIVRKNNLYGIINSWGGYVVEPKYTSISEFSEGRAIVINDKGFKVIDEKGKEITHKNYNYISDFKEGRAQYSMVYSKDQYLYGYLDKLGREIIPAKYQYASDFNKGKAVVKIKPYDYELIGINGESLNKYNYASVGSLSDGLMAFQKNTGGKFGFIDEKGNVVIEPKFSSVQPFMESRSVVNISDLENIINQYGLIDENGSYAIRPKYNYIMLLGEHRVAVGKSIEKDKPYIGSKYGIGDTEGNLFTDFIYYGISNYDHGFASAYDDKNTFFIDKRGAKVEKLPIISGIGVLTIKNGLIKAEVDYRISYYDKQGRLIWRQNEVIPLNSNIKVIEKKYKPNKDYLVYYPQIIGMLDKIEERKVNQALKKLSQIKPVQGNIQLDYNYLGNFTIEFFKKHLLVLKLEGYNYQLGAAHGMPSRVYPHVDLVKGRFYELKDLFKKYSDYVKVISDIIGNQIKNYPEYSYVFPDTYQGIKWNQPFYVSEDALYIYFYPYDIAPYAAGFPTFKIPYKDIMNIIDTQGDFWRSFNKR